MSAGKTDVTRRLAELAGKWIVDLAELAGIVDTNDAHAAKFHKQRILHNLRHFTFIGTSGSLDYLKDSTGTQRFWPVYTPITTPADDTNTDDNPPCDGNHDTAASLLSSCTRCFPYGRATQRDLDERENDTAPQDEDQDYQESP